MQLISKYNKGIRYLLYAWIVPLKDKKGITIVNAFQKNLNSSKRKLNKIWVDQGSELYNISFKKWLKENYIEMYSHIMKEHLLLLKDLLKRNKIYKHMTAVSKMFIFMF